ncbi:SMC domain protein [Sphaerotilus natans subsp. natans DSM 6575]|uniref:SMC domain protein n=1 Tax=Sphaerotilus natans subsp. natans DSM 6575 TaxID=1286631 RepID=A0A059KJP8_9BURK|nr:AAA family ATPase [Sphaerotilus natans]KDB51676.1 SMC domain protein [Sphaerotilus natans subsp. natans DSM 6575]SIS04276.1 Predicted ATP-binding protein involved in virulence [Sphaerotilus natans]
MRIHQLVLRNFRRYERASVQFHPRFTVLIGNNGAGKTTVLDALAMLLNTYFQGARLPTGGGTIKADDARAVYRNKHGQVFRERMDEVALEATAEVAGAALTWRREIGDRGGQAKNLVQLGAEGRAQIKAGGSPDLPLLLYYGAGRLWTQHDNVETSGPTSQLDAYRYCLDPKSDHKAFERWFKKLAFSALQRGEASPALRAVQGAVQACIPGAQDFFHDTEYDELTLRLDKEGLMPFNSLSDGYRNMVGMVADIAHRASRLNPQHGAEAARRTAGVVLIDEIDLHLHPKWQRRVVADLQRAFPNLQFIATTHSPFILQSLLPGEVIDLDRQPLLATTETVPVAGLAAPGPGGPFSHRSIEDIAETVMGIDLPQRSERRAQMHEAAKAYYLALNQPRPTDPEALEALKARLDALSAPFSDEVAYHAFLEMERLAAGLGPSRAISENP